MSLQSPLMGPPPAEIPLANAPLVRVIAQVRFPLIASVEKRDFMAPFQEAIRPDYPVLRPEQSRGVVLGPEGKVDAKTNTVWRFHDTSSVWWVTLAPDFLALETVKYSSRDDFSSRFERVLDALRTHVDPKIIDRIGVRYIDRIEGVDPHELPNLVCPEVAGVMATPLVEHADYALAENVFTLPDGSGKLMARWGLIPARTTIDPAAVDPIDVSSWLLDLDAFAVETHAFDVAQTVARVRGFAERTYSFFRWVVTDEFLRRYGGEP